MGIVTNSPDFAHVRASCRIFFFFYVTLHIVQGAGPLRRIRAFVRVPIALLHGAILHGAVLHDAFVHGAVLHGAFLQGAILHGAVLQGFVLWICMFHRNFEY